MKYVLPIGLAALLLTAGAHAHEWAIGGVVGSLQASVATPEGRAQGNAISAVGVSVQWPMSSRVAIEADLMTRVGHRPDFGLPPGISGLTQARVMAVGRIPLGDSWSWLVKVGASHSQQEARYLLPYVRCAPERPDCAQRVERSGEWGLVAGSGFEYTRGRWAVQVEYSRVWTGSNESEGLRAGFYRRFR